MTTVEPRYVYLDPWRNALTMPHQMTARVDLITYDSPSNGWVKTAELPLVDGSISANRNAVVRRTARIQIDPSLTDTSVIDQVTPYGNRIKCYRGIVYPNGDVENVCIFTGRIETVSRQDDSLTLTASDLAALIVDARFEQPFFVSTHIRMIYAIDNAIFGAFEPLDQQDNVEVDYQTDDMTMTTTTSTYEEERDAAINDLCSKIGCEWFADMNGIYVVKDLPGQIVDNATPDWVVDGGPSGVLVSRSSEMNRTEIYNGVIVVGESLNGLPVFGVWHDTDPTSPTFWGMPFGHVPRIVHGQNIASSAQADKAAKQIGETIVANARQIQVTAVPNPKLQLEQVILVRGTPELDGLYFITQIEMPLTADQPMRLTASKGLAATGGK